MKIFSVGSYSPERIMHNDEFKEFLDTSDEWIFSHTGIRQRHIASDSETTVAMATRAAMDAFTKAKLAPHTIDQIIVATSSPDFFGFPSVSCSLQKALHIPPPCSAFDISAACSGFVYALVTAINSLQAGTATTILVVGAEKMSRLLDWHDRTTSILFGDGAGAMIIGNHHDSNPSTLQAHETSPKKQPPEKLTEKPPEKPENEPPSPAQTQTAPVPLTEQSHVLSHYLFSNSDYLDVLRIEPKETTVPHGTTNTYAINMNGRQVYNYAVQAVTESIQTLCARASIRPYDLDLIIPHQANIRIIRAVAKKLSLDSERFFTNIDKYANTSAASIPIALAETIAQGRLKHGMLVAIIGFGAGFTTGGLILKW